MIENLHLLFVYNYHSFFVLLEILLHVKIMFDHREYIVNELNSIELLKEDFDENNQMNEKINMMEYHEQVHNKEHQKMMYYLKQLDSE